MDSQNTSPQHQVPSRESESNCWCEGRFPHSREVRVDDGLSLPGDLVRYLAPGVPVISRIEFCICDGGQREAERQRERDARQRQARRERIQERKGDLIESCGIPYRFWEYTVAGSPLAQTHNALIKALEEGTEEDSWLLWGKHGIGKSGLAAAYAKSWLSLDDDDAFPSSVLFRAVPDLFTELRASYNPRRDADPTESELLAKYADVQLLVLDDIGAEHIKDTGWLEDRLYQIIGRRHSEMRPVFITSNLSPAELGKRIGERIMWRIVEMCGEDHIIEVKGPNLRDPARNRNG